MASDVAGLDRTLPRCPSVGTEAPAKTVDSNRAPWPTGLTWNRQAPIASTLGASDIDAVIRPDGGCPVVASGIGTDAEICSRSVIPKLIMLRSVCSLPSPIERPIHA